MQKQIINLIKNLEGDYSLVLYNDSKEDDAKVLLLQKEDKYSIFILKKDNLILFKNNLSLKNALENFTRIIK